MCTVSSLVFAQDPTGMNIFLSKELRSFAFIMLAVYVAQPDHFSVPAQVEKTDLRAAGLLCFSL